MGGKKLQGDIVCMSAFYGVCRNLDRFLGFFCDNWPCRVPCLDSLGNFENILENFLQGDIVGLPPDNTRAHSEGHYRMSPGRRNVLSVLQGPFLRLARPSCYIEARRGRQIVKLPYLLQSQVVVGCTDDSKIENICSTKQCDANPTVRPTDRRTTAIAAHHAWKAW